MQRTRLSWLVLAGLASFLAIGIPYWQVPYHNLTLPNALLTPWLLVAMAAALLLCFTRTAPFWLAAPMLTLVVLAVVIVRIKLDTAHDHTSHNLWPFEVMIALAVGLACALPVAIIGGIAGTLLPKKREPTR